ncbi:MAG TPA: hypothetical protein VMR98_05705 [Candidatus Polarisedimenticolaceae bacterium]|nr:hypothetical protein [Candidatus Polarisedimenticolaceae bacterium]
MNNSISLKDLNPAKLLPIVKRYRRIAILLLIGCLFGYTGYQISGISNAKPDQAYLHLHENDLKVPNFKIYAKTLEQLSQLDSSGDTSIPIKPGKQNPFSL